MPGPGRPTCYKPEYDETAYKLCLLGATDKQLGDFFEVTEQTINNWKNDYPSFFESLKAGKAEADAKVGEALFQRAVGYSCPEDKVFCQGGEVTVVPTTKHYPPDPTSMIFWLKNRQPERWTDRKEHTGAHGSALFPEKKLSDEDIARRAVFAMTKILKEADDAQNGEG